MPLLATVLCCIFPPPVRVLLSLKQLMQSQHTHTHTHSLSLSLPFLSLSAAVERLTIAVCFIFGSTA